MRAAWRKLVDDGKGKWGQYSRSDFSNFLVDYIASWVVHSLKQGNLKGKIIVTDTCERWGDALVKQLGFAHVGEPNEKTTENTKRWTLDLSQRPLRSPQLEALAVEHDL